jgi:hypothetical protein
LINKLAMQRKDEDLVFIKKNRESKKVDFSDSGEKFGFGRTLKRERD